MDDAPSKDNLPPGDGVSSEEFNERHADFCSVFCNPNRLKLFHMLSREEYTVSELSEATGIPQPTVSQHLRRMRDQRVVARRAEGNRAYYRLRDERIIDALETIREILSEEPDADDEFTWTTE